MQWQTGHVWLNNICTYTVSFLPVKSSLYLCLEMNVCKELIPARSCAEECVASNEIKFPNRGITLHVRNVLK